VTRANTARTAPRGPALGPTRLLGKPFGPAAEFTEHVNQQRTDALRTQLHHQAVTAGKPATRQAGASTASAARLLTIADTAERLNVSERHIRRLVFERRIAYRKIGRFVRFHPDDLAEYVEGQRVSIGEIPASSRRGPSRGRG
jgi:excisionase family DNA binding protein